MVLTRDKKLTIRTTGEELDMLDKLAEEDGVTASDFVRLYIRRVYAERHGTKKGGKR